VESLKENVFTFSFCPIETISNAKLWRKYGTVALNFEIVNDVDPWHEFRLSKIFYDKVSIDKRYREMIQKLRNDFPGWEFRDNYGSLISLHAFHKEPKH